MFSNNLQRRITAIAIQIRHAETPGVSNIAKSSYYRAAILLLCTIIESIVYLLVKKHTAPTYVLWKSKEHKELHKIPKTLFNTTNDISLCEREEKEVKIDDNGINFGKLNIFLKNRNIISKQEYDLLEFIRKERNKVHLQGILVQDTGYTKAKVNKISKALDFLVPLI